MKKTNINKKGDVRKYATSRHECATIVAVEIE
jgi:hypothetical protein